MTKRQKTMLGFILVFLSSALWPSLPQISLIACAIVALILVYLYSFSAISQGMLIGFIWASVCGYYYLHWQIDDSYINKNIVVVGKVLSLQAPREEFLRIANTQQMNEKKAPSAFSENKNEYEQPPSIKFNFLVKQIGTQKLFFHAKVRLSWYQPNLPIQQGDLIRLFIRLKPATGLANPDGFNYQTWLTSKNISALGYVKQSPSNQFVNQNASLRQKLVNALMSHNLANGRWIAALSYGDRRHLSQEDWSLMQQTGTAHLFAISGMHLGLVFVLVLFLSKALLFLIAVFAKARIQNNIKPFLFLFSCAISAFYAFLAGFEVPVMRALITLILWTLLMVLSRYWRLVDVLLLLLCSFFVLFPFAILGISFWFSLLAVLAIALFVWRFSLALDAPWYDKLVHTIKLQFFLSIITLPMIALTFSSLPLLAFFANLFMIPIVTFVLVPLCLFAAIFSLLSIETYAIYQLIDRLFELTFIVLQMFEGTSVSVMGNDWQSSPIIKQAIIFITHPVIIGLILLMVLPPWYRKKSIVLIVLCLFVLQQFWLIERREIDQRAEIFVMDVGQGSALIVRDKKGTLLHDTGGSFAGFSMANAVLLPFFTASDVQSISYLLLSHLDNDHAGGADLIQSKLRVENVLSPQKGCNRYDFHRRFRSGKGRLLSFDAEVLWPLKRVSGDENDHSCVIKLTRGNISILLTGDIEKASELALLKLYAGTNKLKSTILIAPHHGSKTSSSLDFVNAVSAKHVVFSSGANNRWGFPVAEVVRRYEATNAHIYITGKQGQIRFTLKDDSVNVSRYREDAYNRWYFKVR